MNLPMNTGWSTALKRALAAVIVLDERGHHVIGVELTNSARPIVWIGAKPADFEGTPRSYMRINQTRRTVMAASLLDCQVHWIEETQEPARRSGQVLDRMLFDRREAAP